ncbi:response regulator [bacterium]|jgi:signal transduction histidine kinase/ActR/RegA family two-component response regulator|nr:response regulator [bacterium]
MKKDREIYLKIASESRFASFIYLVLFCALGFLTPIFREFPIQCLLFGIGFFLAGVARYILSSKFSNQRISILTFKRFYSSTVLLSGALWGYFCFLNILRYGVTPTTLIVLLPTAGIASGCVMSLALVPRTLITQLLLLLVPVIVGFVVQGGESSTAYAVLSSIYTIYLILLSKNLAESSMASLEKTVIISQQKEELELAWEKAEMGARTKSEFLAMMSHEIRTPLNGVLGMTGLLLDQDLKAEAKGFVETIRSCGENLLVIINDILDFSKLESGKIALENHNFELVHCVSSSIQFFESLAQKKGLSLTYYVDPSSPKMFIGDANRVRQILVNLISNAVKFTEKGSVDITVTSSQKTINLHELRFAVVDTGIGIPSENLPKLFQYFSQVDGSVTRKYGGTGLELAICKRLCEMMNGQIWVESEPNKGSAFYFTIQVQVAADDAVPFTEEIIPKRSVRNKKRILLAEDNTVNQLLAAKLLEKAGYHTDIATNGIEAVQAVKDFNYDLVLMDCQMPELDGYEATRQIRRIEEFKDLPIVALTANALQGDREQCLAAGMSDYISKPVQYSELVKILDKWLGPSEQKKTG